MKNLDQGARLNHLFGGIQQFGGDLLGNVISPSTENSLIKLK